MAATATKTKEIRLPALRRQRMEVEIIGLSPLLSCRMDAADIWPPDAPPGLKKEKKTADNDFETRRHRLPDGRDAFPSDGIKKSMVAAGMRFAGDKGTELKGAFTIEGELLPIIGPDPTRSDDWGRPQGRQAVPVYRPKYWPWRIVIPISYVDPFIRDQDILNLIRLAGVGVGIGSWRPERGGTKGTFTLGAVQYEVPGTGAAEVASA